MSSWNNTRQNRDKNKRQNYYRNNTYQHTTDYIEITSDYKNPQPQSKVEEKPILNEPISKTLKVDAPSFIPKNSSLKKSNTISTQNQDLEGIIQQDKFFFNNKFNLNSNNQNMLVQSLNSIPSQNIISLPQNPLINPYLNGHVPYSPSYSSQNQNLRYQKSENSQDSISSPLKSKLDINAKAFVKKNSNPEEQYQSNSNLFKKEESKTTLLPNQGNIHENIFKKEEDLNFRHCVSSDLVSFISPLKFDENESHKKEDLPRGNINEYNSKFDLESSTNMDEKLTSKEKEIVEKILEENVNGNETNNNSPRESENLNNQHNDNVNLNNNMLVKESETGNNYPNFSVKDCNLPTPLLEVQININKYDNNDNQFKELSSDIKEDLKRYELKESSVKKEIENLNIDSSPQQSGKEVLQEDNKVISSNKNETRNIPQEKLKEPENNINENYNNDKHNKDVPINNIPKIKDFPNELINKDSHLENKSIESLDNKTNLNEYNNRLESSNYINIVNNLNIESEKSNNKNLNNLSINSSVNLPNIQIQNPTENLDSQSFQREYQIYRRDPKHFESNPFKSSIENFDEFRPFENNEEEKTNEEERNNLILNQSCSNLISVSESIHLSVKAKHEDFEYDFSKTLPNNKTLKINTEVDFINSDLQAHLNSSRLSMLSRSSKISGIGIQKDSMKKPINSYRKLTNQKLKMPNTSKASTKEMSKIPCLFDIGLPVFEEEKVMYIYEDETFVENKNKKLIGENPFKVVENIKKDLDSKRPNESIMNNQNNTPLTRIDVDVIIENKKEELKRPEFLNLSKEIKNEEIVIVETQSKDKENKDENNIMNKENKDLVYQNILENNQSILENIKSENNKEFVDKIDLNEQICEITYKEDFKNIDDNIKIEINEVPINQPDNNILNKVEDINFKFNSENIFNNQEVVTDVKEPFNILSENNQTLNQNVEQELSILESKVDIKESVENADISYSFISDMKRQKDEIDKNDISILNVSEIKYEDEIKKQDITQNNNEILNNSKQTIPENKNKARPKKMKTRGRTLITVNTELKTTSARENINEPKKTQTQEPVYEIIKRYFKVIKGGPSSNPNNIYNEEYIKHFKNWKISNETYLVQNIIDSHIDQMKTYTDENMTLNNQNKPKKNRKEYNNQKSLNEYESNKNQFSKSSYNPSLSESTSIKTEETSNFTRLISQNNLDSNSNNNNASIGNWARRNLAEAEKEAQEYKGKLDIERKVDPIKDELKEILNKSTLDNYETIKGLIYEKISPCIENQEKFMEVLFKKAIVEKSFVVIYAKLCKDMDNELPQKIELNEQEKKFKNTKPYTIFRSKLIEKCRKIFKEETNTIFDNSNITDPDEREQKEKDFILGNVNFIGELIKSRILSKFVVFQCLDHLQKNLEKLINIEGICMLLDKFGTEINNNENNNKMNSDKLQELNDKLDYYFNTLKELEQTNTNLPGYIRYKIINLMEKRKRGWQESKVDRVLKIKSLKEVHEEFEQEIKDNVTSNNSNLSNNNQNEKDNDEYLNKLIMNDLNLWKKLKEAKKSENNFNWKCIDNLIKKEKYTIAMIFQSFANVIIDFIKDSNDCNYCYTYIDNIFSYYTLSKNIKSAVLEVVFSNLTNLNDYLLDNKMLIEVWVDTLYSLIKNKLFQINDFEKLSNLTKEQYSTIYEVSCKTVKKFISKEQKQYFNEMNKLNFFRVYSDIFINMKNN